MIFKRILFKINIQNLYTLKIILITLFINFILFTNIFLANAFANITQSENEDLTCLDCKLGGTKYSTLFTETSQTCDPSKNYLQKDIDELKKQDSQKNYFVSRTTTDLQAAKFPKRCIQYAMSYFSNNILGAAEKPVSNFGYCSNLQGIPTKPNPSPCLTEDYVNLVYNSFIDVSDCMELPQRIILAKLFNESGFHINMFAPLRIVNSKNKIISSNINIPLPNIPATQNIIGGDAGIGQLTGPALEDIKRDITQWKVKIENSNNPSCSRIKEFIRIIPNKEQVKPELENRCSLIHAIENPVQSLIFYGVLYKRIEKSIQQTWEFKKISELLSTAGLNNLNPNLETQLKEMLVLLGYNAGAKEAVILFENWIKYRIKKLKSVGVITIEDLDFSKLNLYTQIQYGKNKIKISIQDLTVTQVDGLQREISFLKNRKQKSLSLVESERLNYLEKFPFEKMGFPMYLQLYRKGIAKGYLSSIKSFSNLMNKKIGSNICTDENFLSFTANN